MTTAPHRTVYVIGAGPGGLATAAALRARGVPCTVLERGDAVATSWRRHYDRLHLHTTRRLSGLPGLAIPRAYGRWVARADLVEYLEAYRAHHGLDVRTGTEVERIDHGRDGARWTLRTTEGEELGARTVVVATGHNHTPHLPDWPGRDTFTGQLLHASGYRSPGPFTGLDVLVAGCGNTGAEICVDLAEGGARRVRLSVRTPPHIVRRTTAGWPAQGTALLVRHLPPGAVDRAARLMARAAVPDLAEHGLPRPREGLYTRVLRDGAIPVQDVGLIDAVRSGSVEPVAAIESFEGPGVRLTDGSVAEPDAVIAATGYQQGLEVLAGHLGVVDGRGRPTGHGREPAAPGLYFTGYSNPITGMLRELAIDARRIARAVRREGPGR
jgi:putative flavoprotein involved in K+ transport